MSDEAAELRATAELMEQLNRGDDAARRLVAESCCDHMFDYLKKTKKRHELREADWGDAVQKVFVTFFATPPQLELGRPLLPYLKVAALNRAKKMVRAERTRAVHEAVSAEEARAAAGAELGMRTVELKERADFVRSKLAAMRETDRGALIAFGQSADHRHVRLLQEREGLEDGAAQMRFTRAKERWKLAVDGPRDGKELE